MASVYENPPPPPCSQYPGGMCSAQQNDQERNFNNFQYYHLFKIETISPGSEENKK